MPNSITNGVTRLPTWVVRSVIGFASALVLLWVTALHSQVSENTDKQANAIAERAAIQESLKRVDEQSKDTNDRVKNIEQLLMKRRRVE